MSVVHATEANFESAINVGKPVLVDFWATWCGPCRQTSPLVEQIANENPNYQVVKVDVDQAPALAQQFGIQAVPTFVVFNSDGTVASQASGGRPKAALLSSLEQAR